MGFFGYAGRHLFAPHVRPFTYGAICTYILGWALARGGTEEERAASKYLNPPKH
jgi:hypothetical protein